MKVELRRSDMCFGCGKENECGLQLDVDYGEGRARANVVFKEHHQGWKDIVHGGIIAAALDEVMAYALGSKGVLGVTASLEVRFRKPVVVGEEYLLEAEVVEFHGRKIVIKATLSKGGTVHAEGKGVYVAMKEVGF